MFRYLAKHATLLSRYKQLRRWYALAAVLALTNSPACAEAPQNTTTSFVKPAPNLTLPQQPVPSSSVGSLVGRSVVLTPQADSTSSRENIKELETERTHPQVTEAVPEPQDNLPELTVYAAEEQALNNNHTLKASVYSLRASHEKLGATLSALYPNINFSAGANVTGTATHGDHYQTTTAADGTTQIVTKDKAQTSLSTTLSFKQTLLDLCRRHTIRQAELNEISSVATLENTRQDVLLTVRKAWFTAFIDQEIVRIRQEDVDNKKLRLYQAQEQYRVGTVARLDVASAEAALTSAQLASIKAQTQLKTDWVALGQAMGLADDKPYNLVCDSYWDYLPDLNQDELVQVALTYRPELQKLQAQLRSQLEAMESVEDENWPTLDASASIGGKGNMLPFDGNWSVGISLNWSIFDGFLKAHQYDEAALTAHNLAEQLEQKRLTVYQEVTSKLIVLRQALSEVEASETALAKAKESYRLASSRYKVGVGSSVEVSDAELTLSQAQLSYAQCCNSLRVAKAELIRAVGIDDLHNLPQEIQPIVPDSMPDVD